MGTMKRALIAAVLAAGASAPCAAASPLVVRASFDTTSVQFGEPVRTHVAVIVDAAHVRASSVRIADDAVPLTPLSSAGMRETTSNGTVIVAITHVFSCISSECVGAKGDVILQLPPVTATAVTKGGRVVHATGAWPRLEVRGRVSATDLARPRPPFRADTSPPPPAYRMPPSTLAWLLDAAAALFALAAGALGIPVTVLLARRVRSTPAANELERAVRLAREAESRPPADRRRALGLLARLLRDRDRRLSGAASDLAWAQRDPERESVSVLVTDVEREVEP